MAVAPGGIPVIVRSAGVGKEAPLVGTMVRENVAAPPGVAVCDAPLALPLPPDVVVKSITDCMSTPLVDVEKSVLLL